MTAAVHTPHRWARPLPARNAPPGRYHLLAWTRHGKHQVLPPLCGTRPWALDAPEADPAGPRCQLCQLRLEQRQGKR